METYFTADTGSRHGQIFEVWSMADYIRSVQSLRKWEELVYELEKLREGDDNCFTGYKHAGLELYITVEQMRLTRQKLCLTIDGSHSLQDALESACHWAAVRKACEVLQRQLDWSEQQRIFNLTRR